jgi:hypothetical protein
VRVALRVATIVVVGCTAGVVAAGSAGAAQCSVMTFEFGQSGFELSPSTLTVNPGACVQFNNQTLFAARFTVGSSYSQNVPALSETSGRTNYVAEPAGTRQRVTASEGAGSAKGTIVIKAKPAPSPTPTRTPTPAPSRTSAHRPTSKPTPPPATPTPATPQQSTPKATLPPPTFPATPVTSPAPTVTGAPPFLAGRPTPTPSPSVAVVSGPLQPPTGRGTGLPAALAALAVAATGGALLRVLMAEPIAAVDDRRSVSPAL